MSSRNSDAEELAGKGILRGGTRLLNNGSVELLIALMSEHGVSRLEAPELGWSLRRHHHQGALVDERLLPHAALQPSRLSLPGGSRQGYDTHRSSNREALCLFAGGVGVGLLP